MGVPKRLTGMQRKFAELIVLYEGRKFDYECAIEAGYSENRARQEASELQNPEQLLQADRGYTDRLPTAADSPFRLR